MPENMSSQTVSRASLQSALWVAGLFSVSLLLVFHQTTWSMVATWLRSETFAHGFLILPIVLWLMWNDRTRLYQRSILPAPPVALLMVFPGFVWLLATLVDVLVIQQLALVSMLVIGVWAIVGHQLGRVMAFPLLFLFFAVPMGEALVAPMMEFTATTTVWLIQHTGVPVYREGLYFYLPSGSWSVVEACSGVRYIIASITLGVLYAYLTYRSAWRGALFVLASAIVPIFANTLRAYMIVMLGHLSDMTVATGVDHLIYGWVFFGLVIFLLFWLGSLFADDRDGPIAEDELRSGSPQLTGAALSKLLATTLVTLLCAAVWPWLAHTMEAASGTNQPNELVMPSASSTWGKVSVVPWEWRPLNSAGDQESAFYTFEDQTLAVFIQYVGGTGVGEVVGSSSRFTPYKSVARTLHQGKVSVQIGEALVVADEAKVADLNQTLLVWSWYRIGDRYTSNDYEAKLYEAMGSLGLAPSGSYRIVVVLPLQESVGRTRTLLQAFLHAYSTQLDAALDRAVAGVQ